MEYPVLVIISVNPMVHVAHPIASVCAPVGTLEMHARYTVEMIVSPTTSRTSSVRVVVHAICAQMVITTVPANQAALVYIVICIYVQSMIHYSANSVPSATIVEYAKQVVIVAVMWQVGYYFDHHSYLLVRIVNTMRLMNAGHRL
jgi:hypothetical protein